MRPNESFVAQPVRSLQNMLRVIAQNDPRMPTVVPDGIYGPSTTSAVSSFQRIYGLPLTGVANQQTWEQIVSVYESAVIQVGKAVPIEILFEPGQIIKAGESSPYIYLLQGMLAYLSETNTLLPMPAFSGVLDSQTANALLTFQRIAALDETGELDRITWLYIVNHFTLAVHANERKQ